MSERKHPVKPDGGKSKIYSHIVEELCSDHLVMQSTNVITVCSNEVLQYYNTIAKRKFNT